MDFFQAVKSMKSGIAVQSLVSKSLYEVNKEGLLCEGLPVSFDHLTEVEGNGEWQEVTIIEKMEDYQKLSSEQKKRILDEAIEAYEFHTKHRANKQTKE